MRFLSIVSFCVAAVSGVSAQTPAPAPNPDAAPPVAHADYPARPQELVAKIKKENDDAIKRIQEIENAVYPVQDQIAQKIFSLQAGEFNFLRMQAESPQSAAPFFEKQNKIDRDSMDGVAGYFDEVYEALKAGDLWVGRESSLVNDDSALYNELRDKVNEEMTKRPDGDKLMKMLAERDMLLNKLKTSRPLYKYFSERRLWWKSYPDYENAVKADVGNKLKDLVQ